MSASRGSYTRRRRKASAKMSAIYVLIGTMFCRILMLIASSINADFNFHYNYSFVPVHVKNKISAIEKAVTAHFYF